MKEPRRLIHLIIIVALICITIQPLLAQESSRGFLFSETIKAGGIDRTYLLYIPRGIRPEDKPPLLIVLHGGGGTGKGMVKLTRGGFNHIADKYKFMVAYPDAIERHWNDGRGLDYRAMRDNVDDVGFISQLIDQLIKKRRIDKDRVYVTGASNGGLMSYRLACDLTNKIAGIAPVIASMGKHLAMKETPSGPMPVLIINGTKDPLMPWNGGEKYIRGKRLGVFLSTPATVEYWVKINGCPPNPLVTRLNDKDPHDGATVRVETYKTGKSGADVILYAVEGGGHTWPGGVQYLPQTTIGTTCKDFDACRVIWDFFARHKKR